MGAQITTWTEEEQAVRADMLARVKEGAERLDQERFGWEHGISVTRLEMDNVRWCIVGQLDGGVLGRKQDSVAAGWLEEYEWRSYPWELGLDLSKQDKATSMACGQLYGHLTDAWIDVIEQRRAGMR